MSTKCKHCHKEADFIILNDAGDSACMRCLHLVVGYEEARKIVYGEQCDPGICPHCNTIISQRCGCSD